MVIQSVMWQHIEISETVCHRPVTYVAALGICFAFVCIFISTENHFVVCAHLAMRVACGTPFKSEVNRRVVWSSGTLKFLEAVDWLLCFIS